MPLKWDLIVYLYDLRQYMKLFKLYVLHSYKYVKY